jgi:FkbM family methyltransferase
MSAIKLNAIRNLSLTILSKKWLENILCYLCLNSSLRNALKLRVIPISYTYLLNKPEIRIAKIGMYRTYVNIAEYSGVSLYFFGEHYEPFSAWLVSELVTQGDICIDIGANFGSYTFLMANLTGSQGKVFAFEPQPDLYKLLLYSVKMNQVDDFVFVDCRALYSFSGESLKFYISENPRNTGTSSLVNHGVFLRQENHILVETIALKDVFEEQRIETCKLIKIDVERAEIDVLNGTIDLLKERRIDYILLEQLAGSQSQTILNSLGYIGWFIDEQKKVLIETSLLENNKFGNYIFVSPNLLERFKHNLSSYRE